MEFLLFLFIAVALVTFVGRAISYYVTRGQREQIAIIEAEERETDGQRVRRETEQRGPEQDLE